MTATGGQPFKTPTTGYNYSYSGLPTGCASANASSISCTPTATGSFTVVVTVSDQGGNVTKNAIALTVLGMTITTFTETPSSVPLGSSATFASTYAGNSGLITWAWSGLPSGCTAPAGKTLTCTSTVAGTFTVTLTGTDASSASSSKSVTFTVTPVR
ncbi:MAG TPA: hypothetical protein VGX00_06390, partial [Thermoplasmata archaeon]|nr:hypothetical protein [Thermoplasmata archaeon]